LSRPIAVLAGALALSAAMTANASAAQRFAAPGGGETSACSQADPCALEPAIEQAAHGDEVIVAPGDYSVASAAGCHDDWASDDQRMGIHRPAGNIEIHGVAGQPRPRIVGGPGTCGVLFLGPSSDLAHLEVTGGFWTLVYGGTAEELVVDNVSMNGRNGPAVLRDSFVGNYVAASGGTPQVRNVTAAQVSADCFDGEYSTDMTVRNTILRGAAPSVSTWAFGSSAHATIDIDYSSYHGPVRDPAGTTTNVLQGTHNQDAATTPPAFVDAAAGDYHEAPGSPTIDAGVDDAANGTSDVDGGARTFGTKTDIGADEFGAARPLVTTTPATGIGQDAATFNGTVNTYGVSATYRFEYGTTSSYGSQTLPVAAPVGYSYAPVSMPVGALTPNTTYHYRLVAASGLLTSTGPDRTFTTAPAPPANEDTAPGDPGNTNGTNDTDPGTTVLPRGVTVPRQRLGRVLKRGLKLSVVSDEPGTARVRVALDRKLAKRLRQKGAAGAATASTPAPGQAVPVTVKLSKLSKRARRKLATARSARFGVSVKLIDADGRALALKKTVTLKK
jgi:hypothetical protein